MVFRYPKSNSESVGAKLSHQVKHGKLKVTFHTDHRTRWGENVVVFGDVPELGKWRIDQGKVMRCQEKKRENRLEWDQTVLLSPRSEYRYGWVLPDLRNSESTRHCRNLADRNKASVLGYDALRLLRFIIY